MAESSSTAVNGIRLASCAAGIKKAKPGVAPALDMVLIEAAAGSQVAATFTLNRFCAAPVHVAKAHLANAQAEQPSYWLINSGNANAGTGEPGLINAERCCELLAAAASCDVNNVLPFSTGVIGEQLDVDVFDAAIPGLFKQLSTDAWRLAAEGIMTTDTVAKQHVATFEMFGKQHSISGISKGAGMIMPNMATMLCFIATDLAIKQELLQKALSDVVTTTFNRITIDGDTSTNDACMAVATGQSAVNGIVDGSQVEYEAFKKILHNACLDLAQQIVRDGEGASKFVTIAVEGGRSTEDCLTVAYTVAHSPLVKTALFASDPNWGRILAAVGRAPIAELDVDEVSIFIGDVLIAEKGAVAQSYVEADATVVMQQTDVTIRIVIGRGDAQASVWTSDLSHDYVSINADYRS